MYSNSFIDVDKKRRFKINSVYPLSCRTVGGSTIISCFYPYTPDVLIYEIEMSGTVVLEYSSDGGNLKKRIREECDLMVDI